MPDSFWVPSRDSEISTDSSLPPPDGNRRPHGETDPGTWNLEPGTVPNQVSAPRVCDTPCAMKRALVVLEVCGHKMSWTTSSFLEGPVSVRRPCRGGALAPGTRRRDAAQGLLTLAAPMYGGGQRVIGIVHSTHSGSATPRGRRLSDGLRSFHVSRPWTPYGMKRTRPADGSTVTSTKLWKNGATL